MDDPLGQHPEPGPREREATYRLLSCVAAAAYADALDDQLTEMLREALATSGAPVVGDDDASLGRAIEDLAILFRDSSNLPRPPGTPG